MKKTLHIVLRQGSVAVGLKVALTLLFHVAYPTIEIVAGIHAVLALFAAGLAWLIYCVPQMFSTSLVAHEASPEVEA
jgi:hypothetical protein